MAKKWFQTRGNVIIWLNVEIFFYPRIMGKVPHMYKYTYIGRGHIQ